MSPVVHQLFESSLFRLSQKVIEWFLEYDINQLKSAIGNFSSLSTYDIRKYESIAAGMSRIDQMYEYSGMAS